MWKEGLEGQQTGVQGRGSAVRRLLKTERAGHQRQGTAVVMAMDQPRSQPLDKLVLRSAPYQMLKT